MNRTCAVVCAAGVAAFLSGSAFADHIRTFSFDLTVAQTNPGANVGAFTPSGSAVVSIDTNSQLLSWDVDYEGLTGPIVAPGAHFHGPAILGDNAGVQVFLTDGDPPEPATGSLVGTATISLAQQADLIAGLWYLNIHTAQNPSGELRGQVIPAPATVGLFGFGLLCARRRR